MSLCFDSVDIGKEFDIKLTVISQFIRYSISLAHALSKALKWKYLYYISHCLYFIFPEITFTIIVNLFI